MKTFFEKYIHYNIPFYVLAGISMLMLIISWLMPPQWQIHPSVMVAVSELFAFASLWTILVSIENGGNAKLSKGDISVEINKEENN